MRIALWDIDHTIANSSWRDALMPKGDGGSWDQYHDQSVHDRVHDSARLMILSLGLQGYTNIGITVRPDKWRALTNQWLMKHQVPLSYVIMRGDKDFRPAVELKLALIEASFTESQRRDIEFYVDDRDDCCAAVTEKYGITSFVVRHRILS